MANTSAGLPDPPVRGHTSHRPCSLPSGFRYALMIAPLCPATFAVSGSKIAGPALDRRLRNQQRTGGAANPNCRREVQVLADGVIHDTSGCACEGDYHAISHA